MARIFLPDREVIISPHAEERLATRNVTHNQVKETMLAPDTTSGNPDHPNGFNYWKTFEGIKIRVSTKIISGTEVVVTVCVYKKEA